MSSWPEFFLESFAKLAPRLPAAMRAGGCREPWIQAELVMAAARLGDGLDLYSNAEPVPGVRGGRYDLSAGWRPARMVAELKVVGGFFGQAGKCIVGAKSGLDWRQLAPARPGARSAVAAGMLERVKPGDWGLLADASRLLRSEARERYAMLVILPLEGEASEPRVSLDATLRAIRLSRREWSAEHRGFTVRLWRL